MPDDRGCSVMSDTTIILAYHPPLPRGALRVVLEAEAGFVVVGEVGDGLAAVELARLFQPALLVVDGSLPALGGSEVARRVRPQAPATRVVVLVPPGSDVVEMFAGGASGCIFTSASPREFVAALREVHAGRRVAVPPVVAPPAPGQATAPGAAPTLTPRERDVLRLVAKGHRTVEIAAALGISERTVEGHRSRMMRKLGMRTVAALIRYAYEHGIVTLGE